MHQFPADFTKESCNKLIQKSRNDLMATCRGTIYDNVIINANNCINTTTFKFSNLKKKDRIILCGELIERFGELEIIFNLKEKYSSRP